MPVFSVPELGQSVERIADELNKISKTVPVDPNLVREIHELHQSAQGLFHAHDTAAVHAAVDNALKLANSAVATLAALPFLPPQAEAVVQIIKLLLPLIQTAADTFWPDNPQEPARSHGVSAPLASARGSVFAHAEVISAADNK